MASDAGTPIGGAPRPDWRLPEILDIKISRVPFKPREHKFFRSALADFKEAVEFTVTLSGPVPIRALGPALFVGDVQVAEAEAVDERTYRFLWFHPEQLKSGAPIGWGWLDALPQERKATQFRFDLAR
jgi:hypothetical protein